MSIDPASQQQLLDEINGLKKRLQELETPAGFDTSSRTHTAESEQILRTLFAASQDAIFLETLEGKVVDCNEAACQMLGYTRQELLQLTVADLVPTEVLESLPSVVQEERSRGGIFLKSANIRKNGQVFPVEVSTQLVSLQGKPHVVTFVRDITEQERTTQQMQHHMQELVAVSEIAMEIGSQGDLHRLLYTLVERVIQLVGAPMGGLYLLEPGGDSLRLVVSYHLPQDYAGAVLKLGEGLSGKIAQTGKTMIVNDYSSWEGRAGIYGDSPFTYVIGVPLLIQGQVIGVLNITDTVPREPYSERQIQLINLFANQAAVAIHNAQLLEISRKELAVRKQAEKVQEALYRISEATQTAESLQELFALLHAIIQELMPARNFYIALYDPVTDLISYPYYIDEYDAPPPTAKPVRGLTEFVLQKGQPLLVTPKLFRELVESGEVETIGADSIDWLGVPLRVQKEQIGMMAVQSYTPIERYSQADQDVLAFVSTQTAMAIERKRAEEALRHSSERYHLLFQTAPVGILLINRQGTILEVNPAVLELLGSPSADATKAINILTFPPLVKVGFSAHVRECLETGQTITAETPYTSVWGRHTQVHYYLSPILDENGLVQMIQVILEDVTQRNLAEQEIRQLNQNLRKHAHELAVLSQAGQLMASTFDLDHLSNLVAEQAQRLLEAETVLFIRVEPNQNGAIHFSSVYRVPKTGAQNKPGDLNDSTWSDFTAGFDTDQPPQSLSHEEGLTEVLISARIQAIASQVVQEQRVLLVRAAEFAEEGLNHKDHKEKRTDILAGARGETGGESMLAAPLLASGRVLGVLLALKPEAEPSAAFGQHDQELLKALCHSAAIALEKAQLFAETQRRAEQLSLLYDAGIALNQSLDPRVQMEALSKIAMQALHADNSGFFRYDPATDEVYYEFGIGRGIDLPELTLLRVKRGEERGLIGWVAQERKPLYLPDVSLDPRWIPVDPEIRSTYWVPIEHEGRLLGLLSVSSTQQDAFSTDDRWLLQLFANQVAVALDKVRLYQEAVAAAERRTALHWLSQEIVAGEPGVSLEPERIYTAIYQAALKLMPAEAFIIAMEDKVQKTISLVYCIDQGERYAGPQITSGTGLSGHVINSGKSLILDGNNLEELGIVPVHIGTSTPVRSILAVPMRVGERVMGMISAQCYHPHAYTSEDANLLEILAASAAIALENAFIFARLQANNLALAAAYDATIEGWSRALEMRDKETKGHSLRVTRMTLRLAQELGFSEKELLHLRRGVLLHDIGKMAIPDHILLKPGPLSEDEWQVMRQHPEYAYRMLADIPFLEPALDIPYCHHENWDGTGYPRGLKNEEIPIAARLFALVDVWDALSRDRPYRLAWPPAAIRKYIQQQANKRFDPALVPIFMRLLDAGGFAKTDAP